MLKNAGSVLIELGKRKWVCIISFKQYILNTW